VRPGEDLDRALAVIARAAEDAGRDPAKIGMEGRIGWDPVDHDRFVRQAERWRAAGATHLGINTMSVGLATVDDHIDALSTAAQLLDLTA
jgi:triphosphoribosyl-dephospho-CoA synthetase